MRVLCFGYGYVATALAAQVQAAGGTLHGTARDGRTGLRYAAGKLDAATSEALAQATHILISTPPHAGEELLARAIARANPGAWLGYLSTTGVYGDTQGDWVTEQSPTNPTEPRSLARLAAERLWLGQGAHAFRLAGIYGPGRSALDAVREGRAQRIDKPGHVFCRIHVQDIARALFASMQAPTPGEIYNLADDHPAPQHEVVAEACRLLGVEPPPMAYYEAASLSPMAASFYAASRRVMAKKIKEKHAIKWLNPSYREGLATILQEEQQNACKKDAYDA